MTLAFSAIDAKGTVAVEEKTPTYVHFAAATLGGVDLVTIFGNVNALAKRNPSRLNAYLGIVAGVASIGFGVFVASEENKENMGTFFGIAGGVSIGLGAFSLRLAHQLGQQNSREVSLVPIIFRDGPGYVGGIGISVRY
jgi:hypothetical protein